MLDPLPPSVLLIQLLLSTLPTIQAKILRAYQYVSDCFTDIDTKNINSKATTGTLHNGQASVCPSTVLTGSLIAIGQWRDVLLIHSSFQTQSLDEVIDLGHAQLAVVMEKHDSFVNGQIGVCIEVPDVFQVVVVYHYKRIPMSRAEPNIIHNNQPSLPVAYKTKTERLLLGLKLSIQLVQDMPRSSILILLSRFFFNSNHKIINFKSYQKQLCTLKQYYVIFTNPNESCHWCRRIRIYLKELILPCMSLQNFLVQNESNTCVLA